MPRIYKRKTGVRARKPVNENILRLAVKEVLDGKSVRGTAKQFALCVMTLRRYVYKKQAALREKRNQDIQYTPDYSKARIFTPLQEEELKKYFETARKSNNNDKLSPIQMRQLAYQYASENEKKVPPKWHERKMASYDWLHSFMNRHKSMSPKFPEPREKGLESSVPEASSPVRDTVTIHDESSCATQDETADSVDDPEYIPSVKQESTENNLKLYVSEDDATNITAESSENINKNTCNKDECDTFGQLIAHKLRKLSARNKLLAERRINDVLFDLELEELDPLTGNREDRSFCFVATPT